AEVGVLPFGAGLRVVAVGEHGDARRLRGVALAEQPLVVGTRVDPLVDPLALLVGTAAQDDDLGEAAVRRQWRPDRNPLAPDVLHRLRPADARVRNEQVDREDAVVGGGLPFVRPGGKHQGSPGPGQDGVRVEVPLVLERGLDAESLRGRMEHVLPVLVADRVDRLALVLPYLPIGGGGADRGLGPVGNRHAVLLWLPLRPPPRAEAEGRESAPPSPRPETHRMLLPRAGGWCQPRPFAHAIRRPCYTRTSMPPRTSRAIVQTGPRQLELRDLPIPELTDETALLRVEACGICGSDA